MSESQPQSIMTKLYISVMLGISNVMAFLPGDSLGILNSKGPKDRTVA
jgi:hypothetical protein